LRPRLVTASAAASALLAGCLFETTPPKRNDPVAPPPDPHATVVTGLVQLVDAGDFHTRSAPGWYVAVIWYRADHTGDGQPDAFNNQVIAANQSGVYEARLTSPEIVRVAVAARLCVVDADAMQCCFDERNPCNGPECAVWTAPRVIDLGPGVHHQQNLAVRCATVP
jgi:hypothetical protein